MSEPTPLPVAVQVLPELPRYLLRTADPLALSDALGLPLPARIGQGAATSEHTALRLGPDEWMIASRTGIELTEPQTDTLFSLVDVSDRELTIEISGPGSLAALAAGCPRDLSGLAVGGGVRTVYEHVPVVVLRRSADTFELNVWRSYVPHIKHVLTAVQKELAIGL
ncbi:MAG: sarcosine oxidase subunit gamma family protein [Pseudomonadota bacterium]